MALGLRNTSVSMQCNQWVQVFRRTVLEVKLFAELNLTCEADGTRTRSQNALVLPIALPVSEIDVGA